MFKNKLFLALIVKKYVDLFEDELVESIENLIDDDIRLDFVHEECFDEGCFTLDEKHSTIQEEIISYDVRFFVKDSDSNQYVKVIINFDQEDNDRDYARDMSACYLASHNVFIAHEDNINLKAIYHLYAHCNPIQILSCEYAYSATLLNGFSDKDQKISIKECALILNILKLEI